MTILCLMGLGCSRADDKSNGYSRPQQRMFREVLDPISDEPPVHHVAATEGGLTPSSKSEGLPRSWPAQYEGDVHDHDEDGTSSPSSSAQSRTGSWRGTSGSDKDRSDPLFDHTEKRSSSQIGADSQQVQSAAAFSMDTSVTLLSEKSLSRTPDSSQDSRHMLSAEATKPVKNEDGRVNLKEDRNSVQADSSPNRESTTSQNRASSHRHTVSKGFPKHRVSSTGLMPKEQRWLDSPKSSVASAEWDPSTPEDDKENDVVSLTKSPFFQHSVIRQHHLKKEQGNRAKSQHEEENEQQQEEEGGLQQTTEWQQQQEQQRQKLKAFSSSESLSEAKSNSSSPSSLYTVRTAVPGFNTRKTTRITSDQESGQPLAAVERSVETGIPAEEWKSFSDPDAALRAAHRKLDSPDWEVKTEGLSMVQQIVHFHPETFSSPPVNLHSTVLLVVKEVKNLRSQVSRLAIVCLGDMFVGLKRAMDLDVDIVAQHLLAKSGESNNFIRDDVERSLSAMVEGVTTKQALLALIGGGANHKNATVRRTTAQFLVSVVERMGPGKILSGAKDVTDRVLPTAAQFVLDGSPETRYYGRKILYMLMSHQDFGRMLTRYLPSSTLRNIQDVVENLKNKGLGEKPSETASARSRRSGQGSRMETYLRAGSTVSSGNRGGSTSPALRKSARTDASAMDEVRTVMEQLASSDWRVRYDAVSAFQDMCAERPDTVSLHIVKIFDQFLPRMQDANTKVNLHALKVMLQVVPLLKEALQSVISVAVTAIIPNLSSKNRQISDTASNILDSYLEHLDHAVLIQPFSSQAQWATGQSKAEMVMKVAYLTHCVYERKSKQVMLHVLPLLWHLLSISQMGRGSGSGELQSATAALASTLYSSMGQILLDKAGAEPSMTAQHMNTLREIL